jgi:hypothetical protein
MAAAPRLPLCQCLPADLPVALPLGVLILQTAIPIMIRMSRSMRAADAQSYNPGSLTFMAEVLKCSASMGFMYAGTLASEPPASTLGQAYTVTFQRFRRASVELRWVVAPTRLTRWRGLADDSGLDSPLFIPAALYFLGNVSGVYALSNIRSYIFSAIMNARIVFAALLSLVVLRKVVTSEQWRAIVVIFCAATSLCMEDMQVKVIESTPLPRFRPGLEAEGCSAQGGDDQAMSKQFMGILLSLSCCFFSAAGGVFMEKYLSQTAAARAKSGLGLWEQQARGIRECWRC